MADKTGIPEIRRAQSVRNLRLDTVLKIRWITIIGQTIAVLVVWLYLGYDFYSELCFALITASVLVNIIVGVRYPINKRLSSDTSNFLLAYDIVQLSALLFLTGGLQNPFSILILVPVFICATTFSMRYTLIQAVLGIVCTTVLAFAYFPLPSIPGEVIELPSIYVAGMWVALVSSLSFTSSYAYRVSDETRKLADALSATELVLQREQYLSNLDGLAAAAAHELGTPLATIALVSKEMSKEFEENSDLFEDAQLLRSQAERCREILQTLTSLSSEGDRHIGIMPFTSFMEDIAAPYRDKGIEVEMDIPEWGNEPECARNPAILHGLRNIVENAVEYAQEKVVISAFWDDEQVQLTVNDDGAGFGEELILKIGEPFVRDPARTSQETGGLGLGLFIAKTLLERSGGKLKFSDKSHGPLSGAFVSVVWPREKLEI